MTTTITSRFRNSLWIAPVLFGILVSVLILICINLSEGEDSRANANVVVAAVIILIVYICYNSYHAIRRFIKVMASPNELVLQYILTNNRITVNYTDIVHVSLVRENTDYYDIMTRFTLIPKTKLRIELSSGKNLYLFEEYYENFDELKEAIRRARFKLD